MAVDDPTRVKEFGSSLHDVFPVMPLLGLPAIGQWPTKIQHTYSIVESTLNPLVFDAFKDIFGVDLTNTETTAGLPFVKSPTPLLLAILAYLTVVWLGVRRIKSLQLKPRQKEPQVIQTIVLLHNLFLCGLSLYMCIGIYLEAYLNGYSIWGNAYNPKQTRMAFLIYIFYISKFFEFGDTLIMVAKRNIRQISFLHVYHHSSIAVIWWTIAYHAPGGDAYFSAAMNSGVHVAMYGYYFLAAALGKNEKRKKKYLFWGRYVTQLQMAQFVLNLFQSYWVTKVNAPYPSWLSKILFFYMISLLALFGQFYVQKYISPPRKERGKSE